jgi:hypothetical protein
VAAADTTIRTLADTEQVQSNNKSLVQLRRRSLPRPEYKRASYFAGAGNCMVLRGLHR